MRQTKKTDGNILDYLDWRGDLSLKTAPFNEVDNLLLAGLSYVQLEGIVPGIEQGGFITIRDCAAKFFEKKTVEDYVSESKSWIVEYVRVLEKLAKTKRFCNAKLMKLESIIDHTEETQFAALCILLEDQTVYVSYRGTDDTLVGWKEDFNMAYMMPVPSQKAAKEYLEMVMKNGLLRYRVGGHSKGGNLALYASVFCDPVLQSRIIQVYNNDGPGFLSDVTESALFAKMKSKITYLVPGSSVVGMVLKHDSSYKIVKSDETGIMQHRGLSWRCIGTSFVKLRSLSRRSKIFTETLMEWVDEMSDLDRMEFVSVLFTVLESDGAKNLSELNGLSFARMITLLRSLKGIDAETKNSVMQLLLKLAKLYRKTAAGK